MRNAVCLALCALCLAATAVERARPVRVSFESLPEGATVVVDGERRGVTPITLYDVEPGLRHVRFELRNYESRDEFLSLAEGSSASCHAELRPELGLLLVTSEPSEATIMLNGLSLGQTPRLITDLETKDVHRLLLKKPGYQDRKVEVRFAGRTPLVRHEKLLLDSGVVEVQSDPAGAQVMVNGIARGVTPCVVGDIPKGRATFTLQKEGYQPVVRELALNAGDSQKLVLKLEGLPGTMRLASVPEGARFYVNGAAEGKGPVTLVNLSPGTYSVRCELEGYASETRTVTLGNGATASEEFRLANIMGAIEVRTSPVGATIELDGHVVGVTKSSDPDAVKSDYLIIPNLREGEHTLIVRKEGFAEVVRHPVVSPKQTLRVNVPAMKRVFIPNFWVETSTGVHRGVLVDSTPAGVRLETSPGVVSLFLHESIIRSDLIDTASKK